MPTILITFIILTGLMQAQAQYGHTWVNTAAPVGSCPGPSEVTVDTTTGGIYLCSGNPLVWGANPVFVTPPRPTTNGYAHYVAGVWTYDTPAGGSLPSGLITISLTACPSGFTETIALNGKMLRGTLAANGDVGTTGGSATITPTGTNTVPTFTGTPAVLTGSLSTPVFSGTPFSSVINHTHTVSVTYNVQGGTTAATTGTHVMTSTSTGGSARAPTTGDVVSATTANPSGGVSSITPAGTVSAPLLTMNSFTPIGTNTAPVFTGNAFDPSPLYTKVIFCQAN